MGITGKNGFVGSHLYNYLSTKADIELVDFDRSYFDNDQVLSNFLQNCDVVVHLAGLNRHDDPEVIYKTNTDLVKKIVFAAEKINARPHIIFSSSTQEEFDNLYGQSKRDGRTDLEAWSLRTGAPATSLVIPNVFGPFCKPYYNSVIATFCYQLTHDEQPSIQADKELGLIYVNELTDILYSFIVNPDFKEGRINGQMRYLVEPNYTLKVSEVLSLLEYYKERYLIGGAFPDLTDEFEKALFNTFRCYIPENYYPRNFSLNKDNRGQFVEIARTACSGQTSYSTTYPGITRGNHYHTRKAERFAVVKGKAKIQLRKIGTANVIDYYLDGQSPSYVDMPVWYTHNISNIGEEELITIFWINEPFDPADPDTYFEAV